MSIYEWYVVSCGSKNGNQGDICAKDIGLHVEHLQTILGPLVKERGGGIWSFIN